MSSAKKENSSNEKIKEALVLLEEAAIEKKDDLKNMIADKCSNLKDMLVNVEGKIEQPLQAFGKKAAETAICVKDKSIEKTKELADVVDEKVHKNPWPYIGGVGLAGLLLGYYLGQKKNK
jgi:ElaB/YqjD/DUF883 family membrane-anchored ribosome-binding protein